MVDAERQCLERSFTKKQLSILDYVDKDRLAVWRSEVLTYDPMTLIVIGFIFIRLFIFEFVTEGFVFLSKLTNIIVIKLTIGNCLFRCEVDV